MPSSEKKLYGIPKQTSLEEDRRITNLVRRFSIVVVIPHYIAFRSTPEEAANIAQMLGMKVFELHTKEDHD